ncbi:MAG: hypothetical protein QXU09_02585 [Thermoproteota archaeon]
MPFLQWTGLKMSVPKISGIMVLLIAIFFSGCNNRLRGRRMG